MIFLMPSLKLETLDKHCFTLRFTLVILEVMVQDTNWKMLSQRLGRSRTFGLLESPQARIIHLMY